MTEIPVFNPLIEAEELESAQAALKMGWLGMGAYVGQFEDELKAFIGADDRYVAAVSTGHAALHLSLLIAGVGPDDEVITPSFNNIADFQAILATGGEPVFCDIDEQTLCIDLSKAEELITPRTKAIIVMDYDCILCDHDRVANLAKKYNIRVIHDAAHAFGSKYKGRNVGSFSDICIFSFDPVKTITCIDGGAIIVRTEEELKAIHEMRLIGMGQPTSVMYQNRRAWTYDVKRLGFRYHMANLHAAIGLAQLKKMDRISTTRRALCNQYNDLLSKIPEVRVPQTSFEEVTPFLYYIRVSENDRDDLRNHLSSVGIDTGIHWQPGHWFSLFKSCRHGDLTVTDKTGKEILSLPMNTSMSLEDGKHVAAAISDFFSKN
ncbi:DegT/DnrJ/EryC1/StrS family aminotransferase [Rhodanobacter sp. L36]|uniref:DegT/DnrJ/EryC1/StrS family aminotransferase n=1 Tax=Rhodanobacter sp. L36 TaxID=1747221 RepID=UPI00131B720A|nr:DegT/DnrJ/EryC1/StrS family aminotransferase [Rhodanobacter sp. L36]